MYMKTLFLLFFFGSALASFGQATISLFVLGLKAKIDNQSCAPGKYYKCQFQNAPGTQSAIQKGLKTPNARIYLPVKDPATGKEVQLYVKVKSSDGYTVKLDAYGADITLISF
jgi:hypothetical protein